MPDDSINLDNFTLRYSLTDGMNQAGCVLGQAVAETRKLYVHRIPQRDDAFPALASLFAGLPRELSVDAWTVGCVNYTFCF